MKKKLELWKNINDTRVAGKEETELQKHESVWKSDVTSQAIVKDPMKGFYHFFKRTCGLQGIFSIIMCIRFT